MPVRPEKTPWTAKVHMMGHYPEAIVLYASANNLSAESWERFHHHLKECYGITNKKDWVVQLVDRSRRELALEYAGK